ncbi:excisionase family DNA-binding protein [Actinomadura hibisca]|uniref:excisionase family DNA-binding protein n=1 Tax=Actinomadura hibisca TaxID=68565 RepID=UPI001C3F1B1D|nr:excisionase family DNA-binding protein [Actinomadura hibisca]
MSKPLYRISEVVELLPYGRSKIYELIKNGRIRTYKEGGLQVVPAEAITEYVALLASEAEAA